MNALWKTLWLIRLIGIFIYIYVIISLVCPLLDTDTEKEKLKFHISSLVLRSIPVVLWLYIMCQKNELSSVIKSISKLRTSLKISRSNRFANLSVAFTIFNSILIMLLFLHPYTEHKYQLLLSKLDLFAIFPKEFYALLVITFNYQVFAHLFPACFVALYVILCQDMWMILSRYVQRQKAVLLKNALYRNTETHIDEKFPFGCYNTAISVFKRFESLMYS